MTKLKNQSNKEDLAAKQSRFIRAVEGIGDILVFETKRSNKNKQVMEGLKNLKEVIQKLLSIQKNDPEKYERLLVAQEFFDLYSKDQEEAKLAMAFAPERYLISFSTAVNQFLRIHKAALDTSNSEISAHSSYNLHFLLSDIVKVPGNDIFVDQILQSFFEITRAAIEKDDVSAYSAAVHWYVDIVFRSNDESRFDLSYLDILDKYFYQSIRFIVSKENNNLFRSFVSYLVDGGIHVSFHNEGKMWHYTHLIYQFDKNNYEVIDKKISIEKRVQELELLEYKLYKKDDLNKWLKKFGSLKSDLKPYFLNAKLESEANRIEKDIREYAITKFKFNNLLELVHSVGAYCLFKKKYAYILLLWEYKQPPDSDAMWGGNDIIPENADQLIQLVFAGSTFDRRYSFWEDHHGSERYYKQYFVLFLFHIAKRRKDGMNADEVSLTNYSIQELKNIEDSMDSYIEVAEGLRGQSIVAELKFENPEEFISQAVGFLKKLKSNTHARIEEKHKRIPISQKKIDEFKAGLFKGYEESAVMKDLLKHYNLYAEGIRTYNEKSTFFFHQNTVTDKSPFIEDWYVHYRDWGSQYGRTCAENVTIFALKEIQMKCDLSNLSIEGVLESFDVEKAIIFVVNQSATERFKDTNFKSKWFGGCPPSNVPRYEGCYVYRDHFIPVYEFFKQDLKKLVLIINQEKFGKFYQTFPLNIAIESFADNAELMDRFLSKPPDWLKKIGDKHAQREHLLHKVLLKIYEDFEFKFDTKFQGYKLEEV